MTTTNTITAAERATYITSLQNAMSAREAELEILARKPAVWVIVWHGAVLRTDGHQVGMFGPSVHAGTRQYMQGDAERFAALASDDDPVRAMCAADALDLIRADNAELLASLTKVAA